MTEILHNSWASIASRGNSKKVVRLLSVPNSVDPQFKLQSKVIYQNEYLDGIIRMQKATAIVKQALTPDSALFSIPLIETQCGPVQGFHPISNYGSSSNGDLLVEVKFIDESSLEKTICTGVKIKNTIIKGTFAEEFLEKLMSSLLVYGQVLQVKEYTCGGYFEGELSVILNIAAGYTDEDSVVFTNEPLSNNLYLYEWDCFASASFKGAPIVCHWCHHAGHVRSKCPELAKTKCFSCQGYGHTAKFCKKKTFQPVHVNTPNEQSNMKMPTIVKQSISDSDTDLPDAYQPSTVAESGSSSSKYATTVETVCMEIEEDERTSLVTPPTSHLADKMVTGHSTVSSWFDWVRSHFDNCFPSGLATHTQGNSRTTIDYVFGHRSLATRLVNGMIRKFPSAYTDHSLLSIDLVPARVDIGPGCWRFSPALLDDAEFLVLLDKTVVLFFDSIVCVDNPGDGGGGEPVPVLDIWESFKVLLKCCARKYTRGAKARLKNKVASLQQERTILLSTASGIITSDAVLTQSGSGSILVDSSKLKELDQMIDNQIQKETRECMLRSATCWHELGERNNKYFNRVIKERQSKQTIQSLKCSATGFVLVNSDDIFREARGFYQELYRLIGFYSPDHYDINS
ncbi:hypothetical protein INT47_012147 [Mucor saturninus]|uniref:CCHC-type domain-containing protein n=1 Tax=Mucor saturninus TaxID=64648 RepID=A0A8H7QI14_9FUNG|nr:hypothetical protein INT47_012147 [Mucor saturninus]